MKARKVRVTNPSVEQLVVTIAQPAKVVGSFALGVGVGNFATAPLTDRIDGRFESGATRGAVKLAAATAALAAVAYVSEQGKSKPSTDSRAMLAAASMGAVSRLVITGLDDITGRKQDETIVLDAEVVDDNDNDESEEAMEGSLLTGDYFKNGDASMNGTAHLFTGRSFGAYLES